MLKNTYIKENGINEDEMQNAEAMLTLIDGENKGLKQIGNPKAVSIDEAMRLWSKVSGIDEAILQDVSLRTFAEKLNKRINETTGAHGVQGMQYLLDISLVGVIRQRFSEYVDDYTKMCITDMSSVDLDRPTRVYDFEMIGELEDNDKMSSGNNEGYLIDSKLEILPKSYGKAFKIPWHVSMRDYFGIMKRISVQLAKMAAYSELASFWDYFAENIPSIVNEDNENITDADIDYTNVWAAIEALKFQKDAASRFIGINGTLLIGGPKTEEARHAVCYGEKSGANSLLENQLRNKLIPITTSFITGKQWFVMAEPSVVPIFYRELFAPWGGKPILIRRRSDIEVLSGATDSNIVMSGFGDMHIAYAVNHIWGFGLSQTASTGIGIYGRVDE